MAVSHQIEYECRTCFQTPRHTTAPSLRMKVKVRLSLCLN